MRNPWLKKNPLMSLWLSGANRVMASARGQVTAAAKREANKAGAEVTAAAAQQVADFWTRPPAQPTARGRKRRTPR